MLFQTRIDSPGDYLARREMDRFLARLEGCSDQQLGEVVFNAHVARSRLIANMGAPPRLFVSPFAAPATLVRTWRKTLAVLHRKAKGEGDGGFASGLDVWRLSLDAVAYPKLSDRGRRLWSLLAHGFASARERATAVSTSASTSDQSPSPFEIESIPSGLEPRDAHGYTGMLGLSGSAALKRREESEKEAAERAAVVQEPTWSELVERLAALREALRLARERYALGAGEQRRSSAENEAAKG